MKYFLYLMAACCSISATFANPLGDSYDHGVKPQCKAEDAQVRREWRTLSKAERKHYTDAVLCLRSKKPSLYSPKEVPGVSSRYDDFQVVHINQTFFIHFNGPFLSWHRWFVWTYEQTLKRECGYKGTQPYWDWTLDAHDLLNSPVFDGSPYSMSGNGAPTKHTSSNATLTIDVPTFPKIISTFLGPTKGGGCVTSGPFAHVTVPFGPINPGLKADELYNPQNLAYKPHCLKRDLNPFIANNSLTATNVASLLASPNITVFNNRQDLSPVPGSYLTTHAAGHSAVGGDLRDVFASPGDPLFFLHHAQVDRLWTIWQSRDPATRQFAISGTQSWLNYPPTSEATIEDFINLEKLGGKRKIKEFMDTKRGPFCYRYE